MIKYIAAISGGPDSMAMLDIYKENIALVCHVNYQKRNSAYRDSTIVKKYCKKHHIKFRELVVTDEIYRKYQKSNNNFQAIARLIRYDFFLKCAKRIKLNLLLVAHNKDDFLETALMQLKRKSKTLFYGISETSNYQWLIIKRPLLGKRKFILQNYCDEHRIPYGIDETNFLDIYQRNIVRKQVSKWNDKKFQTEYEIVQYKNKTLHDLYITTQIAYQIWQQTKWSICSFNKTNKLWQPHLVYNLFTSLQLTNINHNKIMLVINFINNGKNNSKLRLGDNYFLTKDGDKLCIIKKAINTEQICY